MANEIVNRTGSLSLTPDEIKKAGTATATADFLELTNTANASSMTGTGTAILFNQYYYSATAPAEADAGRIVVKTEGNWTATGSTQDATMAFQLAENGTVGDKMTISSAGTVTATTFVGAVTGAASAVTAANEATDTTCFPLFVTAATGDLGPKTNGSLEFNSNTGALAVNYLELKAASGAAQDRALLMGYGTSASPATWSTADKSAIEFRLKSTATSGSAYGIYIGMEGAADSEHIPIRGRCYLTGATANAHGGHFTLEDNATNGKITGLGTGLRANWVLGGAAQEVGGTYYGAMAEIFCNASADPTPVTRYACLAVGVGGDATAAALCKNAIDFYSSGADATTNMIYTHTHTPGDAAGSVRVLINGVARYLKFWAAE